eukprot:TRINITY_DN12367_c0_g2_i1.p1 TRINITY_DN12367_c0_g2~~TRINITY_DN12367_c0_g2_i1.p1  ORF type:complete len:1376 (-),score=242.61 TRINITY_DN12367_c0_g2_i1:27-4154(-)
MSGLASNSSLPAGAEEDYLGRWSENFWQRHWPLVLIMVIELSIVGGMYAYHIMWVKVQRRRAKESAVMHLTEAFSIDLLRRFLPAAKVEKYRFRGLTKKQALASLSFADLTFELPSGEQLLQGVSGEFRAGRMCAILGPSGAGKTTLINVLCGKASYGQASGTICFNGQEGEYEDYKTVMGFVPQEDIVHEGLTVGEQIQFSADLRNPSGTDRERRRLITQDIISVMQLDHVQNNIVGGLEQRGISGGQRKRVSIGLELAADPTMVFLDEPTSGLDAASSLAIVHSLKRMTQLGMTSVMVVHQPRFSLFELFDDVLLLGQGGRTVYFGPPSAAQIYFQRLGFELPDSENPSDWFMDVISGDVPNRKIPHFDPEMLFDLWEMNKHSVERSARARDQATLEVDEWQALVRLLNEEWHSISYRNAPSALDPKRTGVIREEELFQLLMKSSRHGADHEEEDKDDIRQAVAHLFKRIAGPTASVACKEDLLEFLASLQGVVAADRAVAEKPNRLRHGPGRKTSMLSSSSSAASSTAGSRQATPRDSVASASASETLRPASARARPDGRRLPTIIPEEDHEVSPRLEDKSFEAEARHAALPVEERQGLQRDSVLLVEQEATTGPKKSTDDDASSFTASEVEAAKAIRPATHKYPSAPADKDPLPELGITMQGLPAAAASSASPLRLENGATQERSSTVATALPKQGEEGKCAGTGTTGGLRPVSSYGSVATAATCVSTATSQGAKHRPQEFVVLLEGASGTGFGATVSSREGTMLIVQSVADGRIKKWNQANPGLQVKKHDRIVQANEVAGNAEALLRKCQQDETLELTILARNNKQSESQRGRQVRRSAETNVAKGVSGMVSVPILDLEPTLNKAPASTAPRNVHGSAGEGVTFGPRGSSDQFVSVSHSNVVRNGSVASQASSDVCSVATDDQDASQRSILRVEGPGEEALLKMSPRTRAVWSKKLSGRSAVPTQENERRQVGIAEDASYSEITGASDMLSDLGGAGLEVVLEVSPEKYLRSRKTTGKSFTSAGQLQQVASNSKPPGFLRQLLLLVHRSSIQWWRGNWHRGIFLGVICGSSVTLGLLDTFVVKEAEWQIMPYLNLHSAEALLTTVFCLNLFSTDRPVFWRERESGLNVAAFYTSKILVNTFDLLLQCFLLAATYYMIRQPFVSFATYFLPFLLVAFASAGLGYAISTLCPPKHGPFIAAIIIFVSCGLLGHPLRVETMADGAMLEVAMDITSVTRWSIAFYVNLQSTSLQQLDSHPEMTQFIKGFEEIYSKAKLVPEYIFGQRAEVVFLLGIGLVWTFLGFIGLWCGNRRQHRRSSPWKQRAHQVLKLAGKFSEDCLGQERKAQLDGLILAARRWLAGVAGRSNENENEV